jgi:cell shape-determining protein MreC
MANTLEDNRQAISEIQALRSQLREIDREAARIEQSYDPNEDLPDAENTAYNSLYDQAKALWKAISDIVDQYELSSDTYFDTGEFDSNCVADAAFNY